MNLLLTGAYKYTLAQIDEIKKIGYNVFFVQDERKKLECDFSEIEVIVCNSFFMNNDIKLFKNLKYIQLTSAGYDRVPLDYIREKHIEIANAKGVYNIPMAEWAILKILEIAKKNKKFHLNQQNHIWEKHRDILEINGMKALILGAGYFGLEIAKRLKVFNVETIAVDIQKVVSNYIDYYYHIKEIDEILGNVDIVIVTLPLTDKTNKMINEEFFNKLKKNVILINLSRGKIIDEKALILNIEKNKFLGVALDVFEEEPLSKGSPLWEFDNVYITPHNSFYSNKIDERLYSLIIENLKGWRKNEKFTTATVQSHIAQFHKPLINMLKKKAILYVAARDNLKKNGLRLDEPDKIYDLNFLILLV